jgi:hypothetical protein
MKAKGRLRPIVVPNVACTGSDPVRSGCDVGPQRTLQTPSRDKFRHRQPCIEQGVDRDEHDKGLKPHRVEQRNGRRHHTGKKAALAIGGCVAALAVIAGLSGGGSHSDSWHLGYENSQTAKSLVEAGTDPRTACRGSLTIPSSYNYDDVIDGCIAAVS